MGLQEKLMLESNWEKIINDYIEQFVDITLIIWGTGSGASLVYDFLKSKGLEKNIKYFIEKNEGDSGKKINNCEVINGEEITEKLSGLNNYKIIIASMYLSEINPVLINYGIKKEDIDVRCFGMSKDYWAFKEKYPSLIIKDNIDKYSEVYNILNDEFSKKVFVGILNSKLTLDNTYLLNINSEPSMQYFERNLINLIPEEVFIDCGSYDGDTLEIFNKLTGGNYKKYIAIEADSNNFNKLKGNISYNRYINVCTYNLACWNEKTDLYFKSNFTAGHVNDEGKFKIKADRLDNILIKEKVTFIKMDIEGAEENALMGAEKIIKEQKPILAICLYHGLEDFYRLPLLMKKYNEDYCFYIRHYTELVDQETVCYAIPKNRLMKEIGN